MSIAATVISPFSIENGISDICRFRGVILSPYNCSYTSVEVFNINKAYLLFYYHFYCATHMHSADYAVAKCLSVDPSVCPSVCPSHAGIVSKRLYIQTHHSSFSKANEIAIF